MPGDRSELADLLVGAGDRRHRLVEDHGDAELRERGDEILRVIGHDHEVPRVTGNGLNVRREPGQRCLRCALREVRLVVDGDDLRSGADREQRLGRTRRDRDDPVGRFGIVTFPLAAVMVTGNAVAVAALVAETALDAGTSASTRDATASASRRDTCPSPSSRPRGGSVCAERGRSSDLGRPPRRLPGLAASGVVAGEPLPSQRGTVPDSHRVPSPRSVCGGEPTRGPGGQHDPGCCEIPWNHAASRRWRTERPGLPSRCTDTPQVIPPGTGQERRRSGALAAVRGDEVLARTADVSPSHRDRPAEPEWPPSETRPDRR